MPNTEPEDYTEWSDQELSDELTQLDNDIECWQKSIAASKRMINSATSARDDVLDIIKQRAQHRGWKK